MKIKNIKKKVSFKEALSKLIYVFKNMSSAKHILTFYLFITLIGAILLWAPISQNGYITDPSTGNVVKGELSFADALFTAASAFSDTGLATNITGVTFSIFGQAVIATLIFIGGIGWFALKVYIFNILFNKPLSYKSRESLAAERGSVRVGVTRSLIRVAVTTLLVVTAIFSIALSIYFYYVPPGDTSTMSINIYDKSGSGASVIEQIKLNPHMDPYLALRYGIFHTISGLNNAGFDILSSASLAPYYSNYGIQFIFMFLFILGGVGYPVIYDLYKWTTTRFTGEKFKFSLFTKLSSVTYLIVALLGVGIAFGIELNASDSFWSKSNNGSVSDKTMAIIFNTMSTRNAGFATTSMHNFSGATLFHYIVMMFIGSAPSSTAGGIRTTTIAIVVLGIWSRLRGRNSVYAFKKKIDPDTIRRSYVVFSVSIIVVVIATLITTTSFASNGGYVQTVSSIANNPEFSDSKLIDVYQNTFSFNDILFEVGSAFGTTGLSTGITHMLSIYSKLALILVMFIGQLGVSSSILIWGSRKNSGKHYSRVQEDITIG